MASNKDKTPKGDKPAESNDAAIKEPVLHPAVVEKLGDTVEDWKLKKGHVLIVVLDTSGNEVPNSHFDIAEFMTKRKPFNDETKYKVVKKSEA